ncbi:MAG: formylglycine-generating enzyme family protein [Planctomycetota bacterium]|nr:formylglycine-generating enzyme family protein [Planctomycetota bacterium]
MDSNDNDHGQVPVREGQDQSVVRRGTTIPEPRAAEQPEGAPVRTSEQERRAKVRTTLTRVAVRASIIGRYLWAEFWATTVATASQTWRLVCYGSELAQLALSKRSLRRSQLDLGEKLYQVGSGDPAMRDAVRTLDDQIKTAVEAKRSASKFATKRREQLIHIVESSTSTSDASPAVPERERVLTCQRDVEQNRGRLEEMRLRLWPSRTAEITRVCVGGGMSTILLVAAVMLATGHNSRSDSRMDGATAEELADGKEGPAELTNSIGMKLRLIPPGKFMMGSPESEAKREGNETQHQVRITRPFYLGVYEVTQEEYERVIGKNPSIFRSGSGQDTSRFPVESISWDDAVEFCRELSSLPGERSAGRVYRLPTEAEWEYACRARTTTTFHFGSELNGREANCDGNYPYGTSSKGPCLTQPTTVGSYAPNGFGLYDMHGNVWEWCADWFDGKSYGASPMDDPTGPTTGSERIRRGGSYSLPAAHCRSALRFWGLPGSRDMFLGFRVALVSADAGGGAIQAVEPTPKPKAKTQLKSPPAAETKSNAPPSAIAPFDAAQAKQHQQAWASHLDVPVEIVNSSGMKLRLMPPGEFLMGSPEADSKVSSDEKPQHRVQITKPFYLDVYEVTQAQYQKVMGSNPSNFKGESLPVETVSWEDAVAFCKRLSKLPAERAAERTYRLPTEAEWEYACRVGSTSKFSFGDSDAEVGKSVWYDKNSGNTTHPVGGKQANAWGLYDMQGNVWEWCSDWYGTFRAGTASDPSGPGSASDRVSRGGSWLDNARHCRSASRSMGGPANRLGYRGFRVAFSLVEVSTSKPRNGDKSPQSRIPSSTSVPSHNGTPAGS